MSDGLIIGRRGPFARRAPDDAHVFAIAPPGRGKTETVKVNALTWRGPAVIASSKSDVLWSTFETRAAMGKVWVLDLRLPGPDGKRYELPPGCERARYSILRGCDQWTRAYSRANGLTSSARTNTPTADYWAGKAAELLAPILHAAALRGKPLSWAVETLRRGDFTTTLAILQEAGANEAHAMLFGLTTTGRDHFGSIQSTASFAVAWAQGPILEDSDADTFNPAVVCEGAHSLYIISPSDNAGRDGGPLAAAVAGEIYGARKHAVELRREMQMMAWLLDETALLPLASLPSVAAEGRGAANLRLLLCAQSFGAIKGRWGDVGATTLRDSCAVSLLWGGIKDPELLAAYERLSEEHWVRNQGGKERQSGSWRQRWTVHRIGHLPRRKVLVFDGQKRPRLMAAAFAPKMLACRRAMKGEAAAKIHASDLKIRRVLLVAIAAASVLALLAVAGVLH